MRVSLEWLKTMVHVPENPDELVAELVRTGTEVEAVETAGQALDHVVTGYITACERHPNADKLHVCTVDVGAAEPLSIVCGAPNVAAGEHVVVALEGAVLPGDVKIKRSKLRGVVSEGMNCSERELGLGDDHAGIMVLPEDAPIGVPAAQYLGIADTVIDCEITPNRPDCLSMTGFATEVSADFDEGTHIELPSVKREEGPNAAELVDVAIDAPELCSRYVARVVRGVKIGPSPAWLARRVQAAGTRAINNVVDVTNYVMYLTGQPLHAFDLGKLRDRDGKRSIVVRAAREGETITTLDGAERTLEAGMAVITDGGDVPVALAGVMGGLDSEIDEGTVDVLLESACFAPGSISHTSRDLDLMSESSVRFERGVDASRCAAVADMAAALFEECCGATVCPGAVDVYPRPVEEAKVVLRPDRVRAFIGADIPTDFMATRLSRLGCTVSEGENGTLEVLCPTNRPDLTREADLAEEVCRLWGMDRIEATIPAAKDHTGGLTEDQGRAEAIGRILRACGLSETINYNFAERGDLERLGREDVGLGIPVRILNPLTADQAEMRRTMIPGLLRSVAYNLDHGVRNVTLYEQGRVLLGSAEAAQPKEPARVAGVLSGAWHDQTWYAKARELDFFDAKGIVDELVRELRIERVHYVPASPDRYGWLLPGRSAEVRAGKRRIGWVGDVHPQALERFGIAQPVVAFELDQEALLELAHRELPFKDIPQLPGVEVDLALVVSEDVTYETCVQRLGSAGGRLLDRIELFDVYRDPERVGEGKKSMAFHLTFRDPKRTLTADEVDAVMDKLVRKVQGSLGAEVRG